MTAIGIFCAHDYPVVLGDLAVSLPARAVSIGQEVSLPTVGTMHLATKNVDWIVSGTAQKVIVVHDELVVAWAGPRIAAASFLEALVSGPNRAIDDIERCARGQTPSSFTDELEVLGYLIEDGRPVPFAVHGRKFERIGEEPVGRFEGSGAGTMWEVVRGMQGRQRIRTGPDAPHPAPLSASFGVGVAAQMMTRDLVSQRSFQQAFGGGYEIAYWAGNGFRKVEEVVYLFATAEIDGSGCRIGFRRIVRPQYVDSFLIVKTANFSTSETGEFGTSDQMLHIVAPPHLQATPELIERVRTDPRGLEAPCVCWNMRVINEGRLDEGLLAHGIDAGPDATVRMTESGFEFQTAFLDHLRETALQMIRGDDVRTLNV